MSGWRQVWGLGFGFIAWAGVTVAAVQKPAGIVIGVKDIQKIRERLGLAGEYDGVVVEKIRVAILDQGYKGLVDDLGEPSKELVRQYLPSSTQLITQYGEGVPGEALDPQSEHGRHMAQIVWAISGYKERGPLLRLYNAAGAENFLKAVDLAVNEFQAHIILHSANWETLGDFNGGGFINDAVASAVDKGVIWVNAAGNYGGKVYNGPVRAVKENSGDWIKFDLSRSASRSTVAVPYETYTSNSGSQQYLWRKIPAAERVGNTTAVAIAYRNGQGDWIYYQGYSAEDVQKGPGSEQTEGFFLTFTNTVDENDVSIILSWDGFSSTDPAVGTDKDLDLFLFAPGTAAKEADALASSQLKQVLANPAEGESLRARETIQYTLPKADQPYRIAVKRKSGTFSPTRDRLRVTIKTNKTSRMDEESKKRVAALTFLSATGDGEIAVPADGNGLTIGDLSKDSAKGPTRDGRSKPDILMPLNNITFTDGNGYYGTSYSAAIFAGVAVVLKAHSMRITQKDLLRHRVSYDLSALRDLGWKSDLTGLKASQSLLAAEIEKYFGASPLVHEENTENGAVRVGGYAEAKAMLAAHGAEVSGETESAKKSKHDHYLFVKTTPTTQEITEYVPGPKKYVFETQTQYRQVRTPDRWVPDREWVPGREEVIGQRWEITRQPQVASRIVTDGYRLYLQTLTDPGEQQLKNVTRWVPGYYRDTQRLERGQVVTEPYQVRVQVLKDGDLVPVKKTVPGEPRNDVTLGKLAKGSTADLKSNFGAEGPFVFVEVLETPTGLGTGAVTDGGEKTPKLWKTPLRKAN